MKANTKKDQNHIIGLQHFMETDIYKNRKGIIHPEDSQIIDFIKKMSGNINLLEVGGGSGALLDLILNESKTEICCNVEIAFKNYKYQCNNGINLIGGNALKLPFKDKTFDFIIMKNVLHHLVGKTIKESRKNVEICLTELKRVVKLRGYIILVEQYNMSKSFSAIIFYITILFSKFGFDYFNFNKNVVVNFLTPEEIKYYFIGKVKEINIEHESLCKITVDKKFKYTILMSNVGRMFLIGKMQ